jgi:putative membrane protein
MAGPIEMSMASDASTRLAFERTRIAYDRTMMAWIRTGTSLISFGFSIYKFFEIEQQRLAKDHHLIGPRQFALIMVGMGLISLLLGTVEHRQNMRSICEQCPGLSRSQTGILAALISTLGVLAMIAVVLRQ